MITQLVKKIRAKIPDTIAIYLFGSFGTPYERTESDLDIAILAEHKINSKTCFELTGELAQVSHKEKVDLIDLLKVPPLLKKEIILDKRLIYNADPYKVALFENRVISENILFNEERSELLKDIFERGSIY